MEEVNAWKWTKCKYYHLKREINCQFRKPEEIIRKRVAKVSWRYWRVEIRAQVFKTKNKFWCPRSTVRNTKFNWSTHGSKTWKRKRFRFEIIEDWILRIEERWALGIVEIGDRQIWRKTDCLKTRFTALLQGADAKAANWVWKTESKIWVKAKSC